MHFVETKPYASPGLDSLPAGRQGTSTYKLNFVQFKIEKPRISAGLRACPGLDSNQHTLASAAT